MSSSLSFLNFQSRGSSKSSSLRKNGRLPTSTSSSTTSRATKDDEKQSPEKTRIFQPNVEEMRSVFNKFDANKDGKISEEEYKSALRVVGGGNNNNNIKGIKYNSDMGKAAFRAADSDGDGFIDFEEFIGIQNAEGGVKNSEIEGAFRVFDVDGNGKISAEELLEVMRRLGERTSLEACRKMIKGVDADGDGLINLDEFMIMMTRTMKLSVA